MKIAEGSKNKSRVIKKRVDKTCAVCGRAIRVIVYTDGHCRGGHYFGKVPLYTNKELARVRKLGITKKKFGKTTLYVYNHDPKPYKHVEYWECPKCYWP